MTERLFEGIIIASVRRSGRSAPEQWTKERDDRMTQDQSMPVGVMDSGLGGVGTLAELTRVCPHERFVFLGDTLHAPYGVQPREQICRHVEDAVASLARRGIKALVIACNTATAAAAEKLRSMYAFPIIGMTPAVAEAAEAAEKGEVLVMATPSTIDSEAYARLAAPYGDRVIGLPCPGLMEFAEQEIWDGPALNARLSGLLQGVDLSRVGAVVLGCTHYVFLREAIGRFFVPGTPVLDANRRAADALRRTLEENGMAADETRKGETVFMTTGGAQDTARMQRVFERLLMNRL